MSIVVIYTFAAVIGLARKATGVLIPAMGLDTHWISPATVPAPAPAVLDHHDSLTQLSAAEAGQSNEPTHMTTASSNLAASRHDTDEQSAMQAADAVLVKDHHVIPAQQKRQESKADQELKMCKQELEHARQQLAAVQSEAAKTAAVWESLAVQLKDRLKDQVIAREHADYHVFYVQEELGKVRRILERSAMAAAIHIHNVEHEVLHSRASITALTDKIETLEQDKTRLANDLNHTRHLLSGAYEAQRQGTAKISAMQAEATTSAAKLKAAEYEAHKLGMYLDMATKMDAMDLKQAHAKFTAERRLLVTALSDIALGGLRARRQLAVARDMANAFSRDARGLREMDGMQKETLENVIADKGQLAKRIEELETQACAASSDPAPAAVAKGELCGSVRRQDSALDDTAAEDAIGKQAPVVQVHSSQEEHQENGDQARQDNAPHAVKREWESREQAACQEDYQSRVQQFLEQNRDHEQENEFASSLHRQLGDFQPRQVRNRCHTSEEQACRQMPMGQVCGAKRRFSTGSDSDLAGMAVAATVAATYSGQTHACPDATERQSVVMGQCGVQGDRGELHQDTDLVNGSLQVGEQQLRDIQAQVTEEQTLSTSSGFAHGLTKAVAVAGNLRVEPQSRSGSVADSGEADACAGRVFAELGRKLLAHGQPSQPVAFPHINAAPTQQSIEVQELRRVCNEQRARIAKQDESLETLKEQLRWLWDYIRWGGHGVPAAHVRRDSW